MNFSTLLHRWPAALGLGAAAVQLWTSANRDTVAIIVVVATLCYLGAAALGRPWVAWAGIIAGSLVVVASELVGMPWWAGTGIVALALVAFGLADGVPKKTVLWQGAALLAYGGIAVAALYTAPRAGLILAGLTLASHGVWDLIHYRRHQVVPRSLAEFCMALDVPLGLGVIVLAIAG